MAAAFVLLATAPIAGEVVGQASSARPDSLPASAAVRPLLYYFEDVSLREAAFGYDQDIQALTANPRQAGEPVTRLFAKATLRAVHAPNFKSETVADDVIQFMRQIGFETLRRGGCTAFCASARAFWFCSSRR